jgi:glutamate dehydrogenase
MHFPAHEQKQAILEQVLRIADERLAAEAAREARAFIARYYEQLDVEDLSARPAGDLYGCAMAHLAFARRFVSGKPKVRVYNPRPAEDGWSSAHTVIEMVNDDMPFLVDSVTNELTRQGRGIHVVIHPQIVVRRDLTGQLIEVLVTPPADDLPHDAHTESWIHVEIDRETDRGDLKQITADLLRVLSDVREAVEDWGKMRQAAVELAEGLPDEPVPGDVPEQQVEEARELLRWLADDHFTFLGYREY